MYKVLFKLQIHKLECDLMISSVILWHYIERICMVFQLEASVGVKDELNVFEVPWRHDVESVGKEVLAVPLVEQILNSIGCCDYLKVNVKISLSCDDAQKY